LSGEGGGPEVSSPLLSSKRRIRHGRSPINVIWSRKEGVSRVLACRLVKWYYHVRFPQEELDDISEPLLGHNYQDDEGGHNSRLSFPQKGWRTSTGRYTA